jgi:DNA polymerase
MSWASAIKERPAPQRVAPPPGPAPFPTENVDWSRLVTLDFETYYDQDYTLSKLSTSEYIRDPRFKAQMVGIKIARKPTKIYPAARVKSALLSIPWATHSLLAHHAQFDGFILHNLYRIHPKKF